MARPTVQSKWSGQTQKDIHELLASKTMTYAEISSLTGIPYWAIARYARTNGFGVRGSQSHPRKPRKMGPTVRTGPVKRAAKVSANTESPIISLSAVDSAIDELVRQQRELHEKLNQLQMQRLSLAIRFEWDGDNVIVYGVTENPLVADHREWTRFLLSEGARRLREFIQQRGA